MDIQTLQRLMASVIASQDAATPLQKSFIQTYLTEVIRSACDRIPLKVRNVSEPFYLAGADDQNVHLSHAVTCVMSSFSYDDLEPLYLGTVEEISELIIRWLNSQECLAAHEMAEAANTMERAGKALPVTLRWPDTAERAERGKVRKGLLTGKSTTLGTPTTAWVIAVETTDTRDVTYRYGMTRLGRALHDGKELTMALKPGVPF